MIYSPNTKKLKEIASKFRAAESMSDLLPKTASSATESIGEPSLSSELEQDLQYEFKEYLTAQLYKLIRGAHVLFSPGSSAITELKGLLDDPELSKNLAMHLDRAAARDAAKIEALKADYTDADKLKLIMDCDDAYARCKVLSSDLSDAQKEFDSAKEGLKTKYDYKYSE